MAPDEAEEWAAEKIGSVKAILTELMADADARAQWLPIVFNRSSEDHVQGSSFVYEDEVGTDLETAKLGRLQFDSYAAFLRELSWRDFEACCAGILQLLGCDAPSLTRASGDQGLDFFAPLKLAGRLKNFSALPGIDHRLNVWLVGQAKHYAASTVSTPELRELVGSVELARAKTFADDRGALEGFDPRYADPVFFLFFTTGKFSRDADVLLARAGVIAMDGTQLAYFLADNRVGIDDRGEFNQSLAEAWLGKIATPPIAQADTSPAGAV